MMCSFWSPSSTSYCANIFVIHRRCTYSSLIPFVRYDLNDLHLFFALCVLTQCGCVQATNRTQMGQMLDLMSEPHHEASQVSSEEVFQRFTMNVYEKIAHYKTGFYSFYLPVAFGMILCNHASDANLRVAREISMLMGVKFQMQDDYLDCFGNPEIMGKVGTDIIVRWTCCF